MIAGQPAPGPADELQLAGEVLVKYWILAVPTAVASLCVSIAVVFGVLSVIATTIFGHFAGGHVGTAVGLGTGLIVGFSFFFAALVALFVAQAVVIRAGDAAFAGLQPNLSSAFGGVITRLPDLVVAGVAV